MDVDIENKQLKVEVEVLRAQLCDAYETVSALNHVVERMGHAIRKYKAWVELTQNSNIKGGKS